MLKGGRFPELTRVMQEARQAATGNAVALAALANLHSSAGDFPAALSACDEAVRLAAKHPGIRYNRATVRRFLGLFEQAEQDLDFVISAMPQDAEAWRLRSDLRVQTLERNHVTELRSLVARGFANWQDEVQIRFALAKELEDLARYEESWQALHSGASLRRRHLQYDVRADADTVDWIRRAFASSLPPQSQELRGGPIFIVGMPRTGTTLLERIVGANPAVHAAGELPHFALAAIAAAQAAAGRDDIGRAELIAASAAADFASLGADYRRRAAPNIKGHLRFIDKMPLNYLYCGLIQRALPDARILHVTRHPMATCHAVYKTLFAQGYPFSYDLAETGEYYAGYRRLMAHWHDVLPGQILDVPYESLVTSPIEQGRRVFEFCGLDWSDAYVEVPREPAPSTTASAAQVRRPIYQSSVDLWRHYEQQLQPLAQRLKAYL